jgi:uncharacterized protein (TIGR02466 family)
MIVQSLFPTPVACFTLDQGLTPAEQQFVMSQETRQSMGNTMTVDVDILKNANLARLTQFIQHSLNLYFENIYKPKTPCTVEITQSWINYTRPGEYHHRHDHPNSLLSGVYYIDVDDAHDSIFFFNREFRQIQIVPTEHNMFNSDSWQVPVKTNDLLIFPSSVPHMVTTTKTNKTRISLAFNTFVKGEIGSNTGLTDLII